MILKFSIIYALARTYIIYFGISSNNCYNIIRAMLPLKFGLRLEKLEEWHILPKEKPTSKF